jgi:hypothetical protein
MIPLRILVIRPDDGLSLLAETCSRVLTEYDVVLTNVNSFCDGE